MHPTHNTLSENIRTQAVELLNKHLAAAIDLHGQMKQAHWNVRGPTFIGVHELFDKVAGEAESYSDLIAERAEGLGGVAEGTMIGRLALSTCADSSDHCSGGRYECVGCRNAPAAVRIWLAAVARSVHSPAVENVADPASTTTATPRSRKRRTL